MQRGQNTALMMKSMITGAVCALESMLMMLEPGGSG